MSGGCGFDLDGFICEVTRLGSRSVVGDGPKQHPKRFQKLYFILCPSHTPSAPYMIGVMPPHVFVLLLEGKANLKDCGTVTMPSADAMAQASPDIINRFQAIKEVNFSGMGNLAGELCGLNPSPSQPKPTP